ncbi:MAG: hydrogenase iron-sulfur subunit [Acidimicrobiales bacterium]|nr:hydrogenase iron-sulfur subunit [Acidimicrobiales bacterium]
MTLGVYLSRCGGRVDGVVDVDAALSGVRQHACVVRVVDDLFDPATGDRIVADIAESDIDAVVLAGHSGEHYVKSLSGGALKDRFVAAGLNPNRIVSANILEQVALAHPDDAVGASRKARAAIDVAAQFAETAPAIEGIVSEPLHSVLILGVTSEAVVATQRLIQLGYSVILADRGNGSMLLRHAPEMGATSAFVLGHPLAELADNVSLVDGDGWLGDFCVTLESPEGRSTYHVGGILLAQPESSEWIEELRQHFKVDIDHDGHARSISPTMHPAETIDPGIMVVPLRRADGLERDKVAAADSAAMALVLRLSQPQTTHYTDTSAVDVTLCGGCAACVRTCAFGACSLDTDGLSHVDTRRCRGCGKCVVSCPVGARDIESSPHDHLLASVRLLAEVPAEGDRVLGFLCGGCGYPAGDAAASFVTERGTGYPSSFLPLRIPCGGRLDTLYVLEAFRVGFDAVCVFRCREGHCHNLIGNLDMDRRINLLRVVLRSRNIDDARLRIVDISPFEGERFVESVEDVYQTISTLTNGKGGAL